MAEITTVEFEAKFVFEVRGTTPQQSFKGQELQKNSNDFKISSGWGQTSLMSHDELFENAAQYLPNGILTIACNV